MIALPPSWFIFFYLLICLCAIFLAWSGFEAFRRRAGRRSRPASVACRNCGMIFVPPPDLLHPQSSKKSPVLLDCPRCLAHVEWHPPHRKIRFKSLAPPMD